MITASVTKELILEAKFGHDPLLTTYFPIRLMYRAEKIIKKKQFIIDHHFKCDALHDLVLFVLFKKHEKHS